MANSPFATAPVVTMAPLVMTTVPLVLELPASTPALMPYLSLLSVLEALPLVVMPAVPTAREPEP